jgi:hypothetical protein
MRVKLKWAGVRKPCTSEKLRSTPLVDTSSTETKENRAPSSGLPTTPSWSAIGSPHSLIGECKERKRQSEQKKGAKSKERRTNGQKLDLRNDVVEDGLHEGRLRDGHGRRRGRGRGRDQQAAQRMARVCRRDRSLHKRARFEGTTNN